MIGLNISFQNNNEVEHSKQGQFMPIVWYAFYYGDSEQ